MRFLSIIPTLFLTALTFGGTSQQTPVEGLAPRDLTEPSLFIVNGFNAVIFTIQFEITLFNLVSPCPPLHSFDIDYSHERGPAILIALEYGANDDNQLSSMDTSSEMINSKPRWRLASMQRKPSSKQFTQRLKESIRSRTRQSKLLSSTPKAM